MGRRDRRRILTSQSAGPQTARHHRRHLFVFVLLGCAMLMLASCGVERTLDGDQLEAEIRDQLLPQYPGVIRSVSCPNDVEPAAGTTLLCLATLEGEVIDVNVTIGGSKDAWSTSATVDARFVAINEVAALLAATFGDEVGLFTSVDCGRPVVVLQEQETVVCEATDPSGVTRSFDVGIDDAGTVTLELR